MIKFPKTNKMNVIPISKNFIENLKGMMNNKIQLHHSHIASEISAMVKLEKINTKLMSSHTTFSGLISFFY